MAFCGLGAIFRVVFIWCAPATRIRDFHVKTSLDSTYTDAELTIDLDLVNGDGGTVECLLEDAQGKAIAEMNWRPWVEEALTARASEAYSSLRAMPKLGRMPCLANNEVRLLINGQATFDAILQATSTPRPAVLHQFLNIHHDPLSTATLAELYVQQGFYDKALAIYRAMSTRDERIKSRIEELEAREAAALSGIVGISAPAAEEGKHDFSAPVSGAADNALTILEGWLDNVRRVKACR